MDASKQRPPDERWLLPSALLVAALWFASAPYRGITHDAIYYAADALRRLSPSGLSGDIFFKYGSQGDFSLFGHAYAWLVAQAGIETAAWLISLTGRLCWLAAFVWLCRTVFPVSNRFWVFAVGLLMPRYFEALGLLSYAEPFATPRTLAEACVLLGIAGAARSEWRRAVLALLAAGALHPLMAIGGAAVAWCIAPVRIRLGLAAGTVTATGLLAWGGVHPFNGLFQQYDPEWWEVVVSHNPMVLASSWDAASWSRAAALLLLLFVGGAGPARGRQAQQRLALAVAWIGVAAVGCWVLATAMRWILPLQLQLWRAVWLVQLLAPMVWIASMPPVAEWRRDQWSEVLLVASALLSNTWMALPLSVAGAVARHFLARAHPATGHRWLLPAAGAVFAMAAAGQWAALQLEWTLTTSQCAACSRVAVAAASPLLALGVLVGLHRLLALVREPLAWSIGTASALAGLVLWIVPLFVEPSPRHDPAMASSLSGLLSPSATLYWDAGVRSTWLRLRMAHYASATQGGGALFSRPLALELRRRERRLAAAGLTAEQPRSHATAGSESIARRPGDRELEDLCTDTALQGLVLTGYRGKLGTRMSSQDGSTYTVIPCKSSIEAGPAAPVHSSGGT